MKMLYLGKQTRYKQQIVEVLHPQSLTFPDNCIKNVLIRLDSGEELITNVNELKEAPTYKQLNKIKKLKQTSLF